MNKVYVYLLAFFTVVLQIIITALVALALLYGIAIAAKALGLL